MVVTNPIFLSLNMEFVLDSMFVAGMQWHTLQILPGIFSNTDNTKTFLRFWSSFLHHRCQPFDKKCFDAGRICLCGVFST